MTYRTTLITLLVVLPTLLWAQPKPFRIEGKLGMQHKSIKAILYYMDPADGMDKTDSAQITNGQFVFTGRIDIPTKAYLYVIDPNRYLSIMNLYLEPGPIRVTSPDSLLNATVQGGPLNADFNQLQTMLKPLMREYSQLQRESQKAQNALDGKEPSAEFVREWDRKFTDWEVRRKPVFKQFIQKMPNSIVSIDAIKSYSGTEPDLAVIKTLFNTLSATVRNSPAGKAYARTLQKLEQLAVGSKAPDFTQTDTLGKAISLHDFKGKYVLIDFWASWCGPCRAENPNVVKNFTQYKDRNFTVLSVSLDQAKEPWLKAIHKDGLTWTHVSDLKAFNNEVARRYSVHSIPQNVLISPDGIIVAKDLNGEDLGNKLAELLPATP